MQFTTKRVECVQDKQVGDTYECTYKDKNGKDVTPKDNWTERVIGTGDLEMIAEPGVYSAWVVIKSGKEMRCSKDESTKFHLKCTAP